MKNNSGFKQKKIKLPQRAFETPNFNQQQKAVFITEDTGKERRCRNITQTPLDYYLLRQWISIQQHLAGNELFKLWFYGAEKNLIKTSNWNREARGAYNPEAPYILEQKYKKAYNSIKGIPQQKICYDVCCIGEFASNVKIPNGKNARMDLLRNALDDLIKFFNIK